MCKYTCAWVRIIFVEQMKLCLFDCDYLNSLRRIRTCGLRLTGSNSYQLSYYILSCLKNTMRRIRTCDLRLFGPKSPLLQTSKNREIDEKKIVRNFLQKIKILFFFEFFSENVLKTLLRGKETTRKKCRIVFEKCWKYLIFFERNRWKKKLFEIFYKKKCFYFFWVFLRK